MARKKIRIDAPSLRELRDFVGANEIDFGCRPFARKVGDRFHANAIADDAAIAELNRASVRARTATGSDVRVEVLEELPDAAARLRTVQPGNRFLTGTPPRGFGKKE